MRIVGGKWAGRHLVSPSGRVRPTSEEIRVAWLTHLEPDLAGARVLELYAGTGALGLEALSRGAASCDFVENSPSALHALKANITALRARNRSRIFKRDALRFAEQLDEGRYDLAFADPPYHSRQLDRLVGGWLEAPFSRILSVEHAADHVLPPGGFIRRFAEARVTTYHQDARPGSGRPRSDRF
jgi:16S rRNA (guanine966-N2)-methyltransferase